MTDGAVMELSIESVDFYHGVKQPGVILLIKVVVSDPYIRDDWPD